MKPMWITRLTRLVAGLLPALLFVIVTVPLVAQPASKSSAVRGFGPVYDAAHETTLDGTIQEIVSKHTVGSPAGVHLLVAGPQGLVDAHLGPFLSRETTASLHAGMPVRIVGANMLLHGHNYLMAREFIVGGRTVTVRSERGIPIMAHSARQTRARSRQTLHPESTGGAQ